MPAIVPPDGMPKPKPVHFRKLEVWLFDENATLAYRLSLVGALEGLAHAKLPIPVAFTHVPAALLVCVEQAPVGCWQVLLLPSHSSNVQGLVSCVQAVPAGCFRSAGQLVLDPVQVSATSHTPAAARHTAPAFPTGCVHVALVPLHTSMVQGLPSSVQVVPVALRTSVGQSVLVLVQFSATSHTAAALRHTVLMGLRASPGRQPSTRYSSPRHRTRRRRPNTPCSTTPMCRS